MGIEKRQPGEAKAAAAAGIAIGEGKKAVREQAVAAQRASQAATLKAREASEQRAMQWDMEKMEIRSRQGFEQELRTKQFTYDKENRAKEWEIEKMTLVSQADFAMDEKKRLRSIEQKQNVLDAFEKAEADGLHDPKTDVQFRLRKFKAQTELDAAKGDYKSAHVTLPQGKQSTLSLLSGGERGEISDSNPLGFDMELPSEQGMSDESIQLESNQKFKVISPEGDEEEIDAVEWKAYKGKGYILADIVTLRKRESNVDLSRRPQFNVPL